MSIGIGNKLGVHEILSLLGKGGMGEVYRARDSRLKRDVAIKILPPEFAGDPDRLLRFRREAEVLASLNHPNIGAIYDFQEAGELQFLVMELVEGETLADRLQRGPLPVEEALSIGAHICDALDAAHEKGVIHRDLKPANISVTPDGRVKVLDFGLAKAMEPSRTSGTMANSPTLSLTATHAGLILGTATCCSGRAIRGPAVAADSRRDELERRARRNCAAP
jgi:eukaryotic-like serine/threonine-protein kinase